MAIPKVCGIENEFGFAIFDVNNNRQVENKKEYFLAVYRFVANFLAYQRAANYDISAEARRQELQDIESKDKRETILEKIHRLILEKLGQETDGFLANGARFYLDDEHPEYSSAECLLPLDLVAQDKASELIMMDAQNLFENQSAGNRYRLFIHKNNSDGNGHSYGSHLNILLKRELARNSFRYLVRSYLPFQIARIVLIGGGKLGTENGRPACNFQISQRADFFEKLIGINTVSNRPIFNTRDEPHSDGIKFFRLHDISCDALLCETAIFLKVALTQIVLAMIEDGFWNKKLFPVNPVGAMGKISRDLRFKNQILLENGDKLTGLEILREYLLSGKEYLAIQPMTDQHTLAINLGLELLEKLEHDPMSVFGILDWVTAWKISESNPANAKKNLHRFRWVSKSNGLYYKWANEGKMRLILESERIETAKINPPENTRAYLRSELIKKFGPYIKEMSWSKFSIKIGGKARTILVDNPLLDKNGSDNILLTLAHTK